MTQQKTTPLQKLVAVFVVLWLAALCSSVGYLAGSVFAASEIKSETPSGDCGEIYEQARRCVNLKSKSISR
jgi:photosystem II stability/assembly factor-like uncharacterized protein